MEFFEELERKIAKATVGARLVEGGRLELLENALIGGPLRIFTTHKKKEKPPRGKWDSNPDECHQNIQSEIITLFRKPLEVRQTEALEAYDSLHMGANPWATFWSEYGDRVQNLWEQEIDLSAVPQKTYLEFLRKLPQEPSEWLMRHLNKPTTVEGAPELLRKD